MKYWRDHPCWDEGGDVLDVPDDLQLLRGRVRRYTSDLSIHHSSVWFRSAKWCCNLQAKVDFTRDNTVGHRICFCCAEQLHRDLQQGPFDQGELGAEKPADMSISAEDNFQALLILGFAGKVFCDSSRRTELRRLHAYFKYPVRTQRCLERRNIWCNICHLQAPFEGRAGRSNSDSSTSGDSSSTEVAERQT